MTDRNRRLAVMGLGLIGAVAAGLLMGEQASADMAPFYANLAATQPYGSERHSDGVEMVSADGSRDWIETSDLNLSRQPAPGDQDATYWR